MWSSFRSFLVTFLIRTITRSGAPDRTPTLLVTFAGRDPQDVRAHLAQRGVAAPAGHFYAVECSRALGLGETGGVRIGLAPYTDDSDVDLRYYIGAIH